MKAKNLQLKRIVSLFLIVSLMAWFIQANAETVQNAGQQNLAIANAAKTPQPASLPTLMPPPPNVDAKGYVLMDANTGMILAQKNMSEHLEPASLTKLMTLYLTFQALHSGQIHLNDLARISKEAWQMGGSRMFLKLGSDVPVELLIQGIIVASGNDACVAIAQYIAGTQDTFAELMNQTAAQLGMKNSNYIDATGLPRPEHYSTPQDMALLTRAIINDFPEYYHFFSQKWIDYNHIKQPNRNRLLWRDDSVDGLKTGHTKDAGYCLIASAKRNGMRLISVVMGTPSDSARTNDSQALLNYGFRFYKTYKLFDANKMLFKLRVWLARHKYIELGLAKPLYITIPTGEYKNLKATMNINQNLRAPIIKGHQYGSVQVTLNKKPIIQAPLIALQNNKLGNIWSRITDHIVLFFKGLFGKNHYGDNLFKR